MPINHRRIVGELLCPSQHPDPFSRLYKGLNSSGSLFPQFSDTISYKTNYLLKQLSWEGKTNLIYTSIVKHTLISETLKLKLCALEVKEDGKFSCWQREMQAGCCESPEDFFNQQLVPVL